MMYPTLLISSFVIQTVSFNTFRLQQTTYADIEAVHEMEGTTFQTVHGVISLSSRRLGPKDLTGRWYVPQQSSYPKLAYLPANGWHLLSEEHIARVKPIPTRRARPGEQLNVSSLIRLSSYNLGEHRNSREGPPGLYEYKTMADQQTPSTSEVSEVQMIHVGNLAAYVFSEKEADDTEGLYWLLPAVASSSHNVSRVARLPDNSLLVYFGSPRLGRLRSNENIS
ncbi:unnamed protein product [Caenorhabditis auriculariae]|uniref:Uncharacterized protein n=1 Tax=Caenorhabditis auriculariae TaxID=2777116 RepID=A0A8S1GNQ9_9PELO|nr:unnamed protein product [Caenorhabditis auriculariae]